MDQPTLQLSDEQLAELRQQAATMAEDPTAASDTPATYTFEGLEKMKMKEYSKFQKTLNAGDVDEINAALTLLVKTWPFPGHPANLESWGELSMHDWKGAVTAISESLAAIFQQA
jgi:hypothetical protein